MTTTKCLVPTCTRTQSARGLCHAHYQLACGLVRKKKTTWGKLEKEGKVLPSKAHKRAYANRWFLGGAKKAL